MPLSTKMIPIDKIRNVLLAFALTGCASWFQGIGSPMRMFGLVTSSTNLDELAMKSGLYRKVCGSWQPCINPVDRFLLDSTLSSHKPPLKYRKFLIGQVDDDLVIEFATLPFDFDTVSVQQYSGEMRVHVQDSIYVNLRIDTIFARSTGQTKSTLELVGSKLRYSVSFEQLRSMDVKCGDQGTGS